MHVFDGLESISPPFSNSTVAIGAFDGIHRGHQAIIQTAASDSAENSRRSIVFTFDRHPADLLRPDKAPDYLTTPAQRKQLISYYGADNLVIAHFDHALANLSAESFVRQVLVEQLGAQCVVVGKDFRFGKQRAGDVALLQLLGPECGFTVKDLDPVLVDEQPISSTFIREMIQSAEFESAELALGHAWYLCGTVVEGRKLGRTIGYPTANLFLEYRQVKPRDGIYACIAKLEDGALVKGACSIGSNPTIPGAKRSIEVYLLDFDDDLYGKQLELRFIEFLRPEMKFDGLESLKKQIAADVELVRKLVQL